MTDSQRNVVFVVIGGVLAIFVLVLGYLSIFSGSNSGSVATVPNQQPINPNQVMLTPEQSAAKQAIISQFSTEKAPPMTPAQIAAKAAFLRQLSSK